MSQALGCRIKRYEAATHHIALPRIPLMIRVDGRAFHTFTKRLDKPFDQDFIDAMVAAAGQVAAQMQGFKAAYIQSDEATFCLTDYDKITSQGWFDYDLSKVISISAALMTAHFIDEFPAEKMPKGKLPVFDGRAFSIPANDVVNAFLWRAKDWHRNSLQMYCRAHFSHKALHNKKEADMHEMLHGVGKNWTTDLTPQKRNGTFLLWTDEGIAPCYDILPSYESINTALEPLFSYPL